ncbi:MAG: hypothetical protein RR942_01150 [Romboutsia sp.]
MQVSEISNLIGAVGGTIGAISGLTGLYFSYKTNKAAKKPKVKFNINRIYDDVRCGHRNLIIENISGYNLYNFKIELKEYDKVINGKLKDKIRIFDNIIPVFTLGQVYDSYLFDTSECSKKIKELNFNISYSLKPRGREIKETYTINIDALRNVYLPKNNKEE